MIKLLRFLGFLFGLLLSGEAHGATVVNLHTADGKLDLETTKVAHIFGEINKASADKFLMEMALTADVPGDRVILINSVGGYQEHGETMIHSLEVEQKAGVRVICVVTGRAISMAFDALTRCDMRLAKPTATFMFHAIALGAWPAEERITPKNLRRHADELTGDDEPYRQANSKALDMSLKDYDMYSDNETTWLAKTLLERKYLHGILREK